ncbi:MAG TPA: hypothetical protein VF489_01400 [Sphingobium sp.]
MTWLEAHENLAGWAQFFGAIIALAVTYLTAFAPHWQRKRQLRNASKRLLAHGYETLESFHRTSAHFLPQAINLKAAALMIRSVINEMNKFPIYELDDQGNHSVARRLVAISVTLEGTCLLLDDLSARLGNDQMSEDDRNFMREWIGERLEAVTALLTGAPLQRPNPLDFIHGEVKPL